MRGTGCTHPAGRPAAPLRAVPLGTKVRKQVDNSCPAVNIGMGPARPPTLGYPTRPLPVPSQLPTTLEPWIYAHFQHRMVHIDHPWDHRYR